MASRRITPSRAQAAAPMARWSSGQQETPKMRPTFAAVAALAAAMSLAAPDIAAQPQVRVRRAGAPLKAAEAQAPRAEPQAPKLAPQVEARFPAKPITFATI